MHQESRLQPTYVDGKVEAMCRLSHGSKLTFGGKEGVRLINTVQSAKNRNRLVLAILGVAVLLVAGVVVSWVMKLL